MVLAIFKALVLTKRKQLNRTDILAPYITEKGSNGGVRTWAKLGDRHPESRLQICYLVKLFRLRVVLVTDNSDS